MDESITKLYGNRVRVRVCGLCWRDTELLMVNHKGITAGNFWCPPGGGVEFSQTIIHTLENEFKEETGMMIRTGAFLFGCEYINTPLHAIELFYEVKELGGNLIHGFDPELQIIDEVKFMSIEAIKKFPENEVHGLFKLIGSAADLKKLSGFHRI